MREAQALARHGWPVFPCLPGNEAPATRHGYLDATTDPDQIDYWFAGRPDLNLAVATGTPGPDVLQVAYYSPDRHGYGALERLHLAGLIHKSFAFVKTPNEGLHAYFTGSHHRSEQIPGQHIEILGVGGYALVPPSRVAGYPAYEGISLPGQPGQLDWNAATRIFDPSLDFRQARPQTAATAAAARINAVNTWIAVHSDNPQNHDLRWAADRTLQIDPAADLGSLAAAARYAGHHDADIARTLDSAVQASLEHQPPGPQRHREPPDREAEGAD